MEKNLVQMTGDEFVKKVLAGERDFSRIVMPEGTDLMRSPDYKRMNSFFVYNHASLKGHPINLNESELRGIKAEGLRMPHLLARNARFTNSDFYGAAFHDGDFSGTDLVEAWLANADLSSVKFKNTNLYGAWCEGTYMPNVDYEGANIGKVNFENATILGAKNLDKAQWLERAEFLDTVVTENEKRIIEEALKRKNLFVLEESVNA